MIRERSNLVSDGTAEGTYRTIVCPMCLDDARTAKASPPAVEVVPLPPIPPEEESPLLDHQRWLVEHRRRKG